MPRQTYEIASRRKLLLGGKSDSVTWVVKGDLGSEEQDVACALGEVIVEISIDIHSGCSIDIHSPMMASLAWTPLTP